ncbi:hypothetical protein M8J76_012201 [Diaphorina citri]|nr:hypothetical protein M8J76_012201 [Diaphorina citri]
MPSLQELIRVLGSSRTNENSRACCNLKLGIRFSQEQGMRGGWISGYRYQHMKSYKSSAMIIVTLLFMFFFNTEAVNPDFKIIREMFCYKEDPSIEEFA